MALNKWQKFVQKHMSARIKKFKGNRKKAMRSLADDWKKMNKK